jgi:hypothetical protein
MYFLKQINQIKQAKTNIIYLFYTVCPTDGDKVTDTNKFVANATLLHLFAFDNSIGGLMIISNIQLLLLINNPGRRSRPSNPTGSCGKAAGKILRSYRKIPEITGIRKQYSGRKFFGFFPMNSSQLPVISGRNQSEIIGKIPKIFPLEYCFRFPLISESFLQDPPVRRPPGNHWYISGHIQLLTFWNIQ